MGPSPGPWDGRGAGRYRLHPGCSTQGVRGAGSFEAMSEPRVRVAVEATSLLGPRTGVGAMTSALLERLAIVAGVDLTGVLVSWRGRRHFAARLPAGVRAKALVVPARLAHRLWQRIDRPVLRGFDVAHGPNFVVPPAPGASELVTIHDFGPWHNPGRVTPHARSYPILVDRALARGAHVHTVSTFVAGEARQLLGLPLERVHTIANGFASGPPGDGDRGRALGGGDYVLALGTIEPRKDLPTLVTAMADVWSDHPNVRLVVAGADGWGTEAFEAAVDRVGGRARVVRLGYVSDAERFDLLAGARCLAYPSVYEGFGLPPLEAMAQGCPVITTTAGALPEVCGDAALLVEPRNPAALAAAVTRVLSDDDQRDQLVEAGRARVVRYSWDRMADEMLALYEQLHQGPA